MTHTERCPSLVQGWYQDHHGWLYAMLCRKLGNPARAADIAHDAFVRVLGADPAAVQASPRGYLTIVARNLLRDEARHARIEQAYLEALARVPDAEAPSPEQQMMAVEALKQVFALLDGLSLQARSVFLLSQVEGLTTQQVAEELALSVHVVRKLLTAGLKHCYHVWHG